MTSSTSHFAFAGDTNVYIYKRPSNKMEKILPFTDAVVTYIAFNPNKPNLLGAATIVPNFQLWDLNVDQPMMTVPMQSEIIFMEWSPHNADLILLIFKDEKLRILNLKSMKLEKCLSSILSPYAACWHPKKVDIFFVGTKNGSLYSYNRATKSEQKIGSQSTQGTYSDIKFNPGEDIFLTLTNKAEMMLASTEEQEPKVVFQKQQTGIASIQWVDNISGDFLTSTSKVGALRLWNAAHPEPKEMIKVGPHGILSIHKLASLNKQNYEFLLQFKTGEVAVYDLKRRKILFKTEVAHSSQIQGLKINDLNPELMVTVGFDGILRTWNANTMELGNVIEDKNAKTVKENKYNCVAFSPTNKDLLVIGNIVGEIKLVDTKKQKVMKVVTLSQGRQIFDLDWNTQGLFIVSEIGSGYFFKEELPNGANIESEPGSYKFESSARSCQWNRLKKEKCAVGTFDSQIYVINTEEKKVELTLNAQGGKVLCLAWHEYFDYILASGTADNVVRVWDIKNNGHKILKFHQQPVRSLVWNKEIPWLLISGGDDSLIGLWDIRKNAIVYEVYEPSVSISGFAFHHEKPFNLISTHFDNSVIFWDLREISQIRQTMLKMIFGCPLLEIFGDGHDLMDAEVKGKLSGRRSKEVFDSVQGMSKFEQYKMIANLFTLVEGDTDIWNMASVIHSQSPGDMNSEILHISDVAAAYQSKAQNLQTVSGMKLLGTSLAKKEDRLKESARLMLMTGNFQEYCELQMQLGFYTKAIAYAPKVNLKYWQRCIQKYIAYLESAGKSNHPDLAHFCLLAGNLEKASQTFNDQGKSQDAKLVRVLKLTDKFYTNPLTRHEPVKTASQGPKPDIYDLDYKQADLNLFTIEQAQARFSQNLPYKAAATHLSLSDTRRAVEKLFLANDLEYAYMIADLFCPEAKDQVLVQLVLRSIQNVEYQIADKMISQVNNMTTRSILLSVLNQETEGNKEGSSSTNYDQAIEALKNNQVKSTFQIAMQLYTQDSQSRVISKDTFTLFNFIGMFELQDSGAPKDLHSAFIMLGVIKAIYFQQNTLVKSLYPKENFTGSSPLKQLLDEYMKAPDKTSVFSHPLFQQTFANLREFLNEAQPLFADPYTSFEHCQIVNSSFKANKEHDEVSALTGRKLIMCDYYYTDTLAVNLDEALNLYLVMPCAPFLEAPLKRENVM